MDESPMATVRIKEGKEKQLVRHHPWVFSGAVEPSSKKTVPNRPGIVRVEDSTGSFIAYGWYDTDSHILIRLLSWNPETVPNTNWWVETLSASIQRRMHFFQTSKKTNTFRLVHGEADFLPGIAIDIYGSTIMCMISARVAWDHRLVVVQTLQKLLNPLVVLVTTDPSFCGVEKLQETTERYVGGLLVADREDTEVIFREHGLYYSFQPGTGQKSGFFCDQRDNRSRVAAYARDRSVLDAFSYTGAFSFNMLAQGARSVTAVDSSAPALERLASQLALNVGKGRLPVDSKDRLRVEQADVFQYLRDMQANSYDLIVLDPPKLAHTKAQVDGALRAYKDLNRLAIQKVTRGGIVATFSCSSGVTRDMLRTAIAWAAKDARREVQILETLGQSSDHPIRLSFPESEYLKGFIFLVL